ncbi:hypothetical protein GJV03_02345 [Acinetobacter sp. RIT698]|uniref:hypothetical protein n=1 Tax=Acinetobacter sp. RIT698 TaxID=2666192 RepID=UPI0012ACCC72|nr:hypothetical protein [Acinetobacter sp. RIT698]MRT36024.1 hypothetical protein [Acinetobacter sp. RIT698]
MKKTALFLSIVLLLLNGCKKKYEDNFEYKIVNKKICAVKNRVVEKANHINWLFLEVRNSLGDVVSGNLQVDKNTKEYLFCSDLNEFKKEVGEGVIQSDISIELDNTSSVQEYNFRNYSCIFADSVKLNLSQRDSSKSCT